MHSPISIGLAALTLSSCVSADFHLGNFYTFGLYVDYTYYINTAVPSNNFNCGGVQGQVIEGQSGNEITVWPASFQGNQFCDIAFDFTERSDGGYNLYDVNGVYWGYCEPNNNGGGFSCSNGAAYQIYSEEFVCYTNACD